LLTGIDIPASTLAAFNTFASDTTQFALPLQILEGSLQSLSPVPSPDDGDASFQSALSKLEASITTKHPLYLIIRHNNPLTFITYIPYLAQPTSNRSYLNHRQTVLKTFGASNFTSSIICKEPGEITDERAWKERDGDGQPFTSKPHDKNTNIEDGDSENQVQDQGHQKTKCRLCDRRMKNPITEDALVALKGLKDGKEGACVQLVRPLIHPIHTYICLTNWHNIAALITNVPRPSTQQPSP
jgi:twinfilin-like protein